MIHNKYNDAIIYGFYKNNELIYIGSTTKTLHTRVIEHRCNAKKKGHRLVYKEIDWNQLDARIMERVACQTKLELLQHESRWILEHKPRCNQRLPCKYLATQV